MSYAWHEHPTKLPPSRRRGLLLLIPLAAHAEPAWQALQKPNHLVLMRHATAPGVGDPPGFRLDDCSTQRNLSEGGREQARRIGALLRERGLAQAPVYSSQWCRCLDTARLLGLGPVTPWRTLNSFFETSEVEDAQTAALRAEIARLDLAKPAVLVTHQVNITALTGILPASGEMIVLRRAAGGELLEAGRVLPP